MKAKCLALFCSVHLVVFFLLQAHGSEVGLCKSSEVSIASCEATNGKYISICADSSGGNAYYRFGSASKIEMDVEFYEGRKIFRWNDANTYITFFGFNRGEFSYVFGVPQETLGATAFLVVRRVKEKFSYNDTFTCMSNSFGRKELKGKAIQDIDDSQVRVGEEIVFPP